MKKLQSIFGINNSWFYTEMPWWGKISLIYIRGDLFVLLPLLLVICVIGFFSLKWMFVTIAMYIVVRQLGELIYWIFQQFGHRKYRPYDFGFKNLDNNAVYILYQTFSIVGIVCGLTLLAKLLF